MPHFHFRVSLTIRLRLLLAVLLLALTTSCAPRPTDAQSWPEILAWVRQSFPAVPQLSTADLAAQLATATETNRPGPILLDVRTAEEFAVSHLPGARHIPADSDPAAVLAALPPDRPVVLYCSVGYRSSALASALQTLGHPAVANLEGSLFQWANEGRPLVNAAGPTTTAHGYDDTWSQLLLPAHRHSP